MAPFTSPRYAQPIPPMWNIGSGVRLTDRESNAHTSALRYAAARLRCVVSTPFGRPVVPDVYICTATSFAAPLWPGSVGECAARRRSYSSPVSSTSRRCGTSAAISRATSRYAGPAIITLAPASATIFSSSAGASRQFSGTVTAPILLVANSSSTISGAVRSRCATRSPAWTPAASSAWASRFERSSSSA